MDVGVSWINTIVKKEDSDSSRFPVFMRLSFAMPQSALPSQDYVVIV